MVDISAALAEEKFIGNTDAFNALCKQLQSQKLIPFVGAGASAPLIPTWTAALNDLLDNAVKEGSISQEDCDYLKSDDKIGPLEIAKIIESRVQRGPFRRRISAVFSLESDTFTDTHQKIIQLCDSRLITLNYDSGLENAFARTYSRRIEQTILDQNVVDAWGRSADMPQVLHMHGISSVPDSMIITSDDYHRFYFRENRAQFVQNVWKSSSLIAIGFGFQDPFVTFFAEQVLHDMQSDNIHFALVGIPSGKIVSALQRGVYTSKYKLRPIFYDTGVNGTDHSILGQLLSEAIRLKSTGNSTKTVQTALPNLSSSIRDEAFDSDYKRDLFITADGKVLYVEPRIMTVQHDVLLDNDLSNCQTSILEIVKSEKSAIIFGKPEYGLTTIAKTVTIELRKLGKNVAFRDALTLPNYRKKLEAELPASFESGILVIDNFSLERDERLIRELQTLGNISPIILCSTVPNITSNQSTNSLELGSTTFDVFHAWPLDRSGIRVLAALIFESTDDNYVTTIVDKVYTDLLALCIPLTPTNVRMYLQILRKEENFYPLNRVQIVDRFVDEMLRRPSDLYSGSFGARNKIEVLSAFVFHLYTNESINFTDRDWFHFCKEYKDSKLVDFDDRKLINDLEAARIVIRYNGMFHFRYRFFFAYFLGRYIVSSPQVLSDFITSQKYLAVENLIEVVSALSTDNTELVSDLFKSLKETMDQFWEEYVPQQFDSLGELKWPDVSNDRADEFWSTIGKSIAAGPRKPAEIDQIKSALFSERRTANQSVAFQKYDEYEKKIVAYYVALSQCIRNSDTIDGGIKRDALLTILNARFIFYQVAVLFAPEIAKQKYFMWHGFFVINQTDSMEQEDTKHRVALLLSVIFPSYARSCATDLAARNLGAVFKALAKEKALPPVLQAVVFGCLLLTKPTGWTDVAQLMIESADKNSIQLRSYLSALMSQLRDEVNTIADREYIKRHVALIRTKRELKRNLPGAKAVKHMLAELEKRNMFPKSDPS